MFTEIEVRFSDRARNVMRYEDQSKTSCLLLTLLQGEHNVLNVLQAVAVGILLQCSLESIEQGVRTMKAVSGRLRPQAGWHSNVTLLDDTYNANPNSVKAAIDVLAELPGQRLLVLGDMLELGD